MCRDVQKSEFFTTSSGPFAVAVGINGHGMNERTRQTSSRASGISQEVALIQNQSPKTAPLSWQTNKAYACQAGKSNKETATTSAGSSNRETHTQDHSDISEAHNRGSKKIPRRFRKSKNYQHRKSLPADILQRSVETQTMEEIPTGNTEATREKLQQTLDESVSSESSVEQPYLYQPQKKKISKNIAAKLDMISSSEDERVRRGGLRHSLSAPDLYSMFDIDQCIPPKYKSNKVTTPRLVKQRHETRNTKKYAPIMKDSVTDDKTDDLFTSDDCTHANGTKPPLHPKHSHVSTSPDRGWAGVKYGFTSSRKTSQSDTESVSSKCEVVLRRKNSDTRKNSKYDEQKDFVERERPHSFHELLSVFEPNHDNIKRFAHSLRKCASEDAIYTDGFLRKTYFSDPELSANKTRAAARLVVEMDIKQL